MKTRREFLEGAGALGLGSLIGGCIGYHDVARFVDEARTVAKIGVLANTEVEWKKGTERLSRALAFYRQCEVDAVVLTGAVTKNGYPNQFEVLDEVWKDAFPTNAPRRIMDDGSYDVEGFKFAVSARRPAGTCPQLTFYGEGKNALTDEFGFYPRESNAVYAGSMSGIEVQPGYVRPGKRVAQAPERAAQGLLVRAYSDRTVIRRLDFTQTGPADTQEFGGRRRPVPKKKIYVEDVGAPWIPGETPPPEAPEFWPDTCIRVFPGYSPEGAFFTVEWPHLLKCFANERAFGYEVTGALADRPNVPFGRISILSDGFFLSEDRDRDMLRWTFPAGQLPAGQKVVFGVTPFGSVGHRGRTLFTEPVSV